MNRQQRRYGGAYPLVDRRVTFQHGHTDTHVVVLFSIAAQNITLTPEEADRFIEAMQDTKRKLLEHIARQKESPNA